MRKQKTIKMTASPLDPSLGGSFQPPATHNGDISIVFRGKDMSIHGWDGSAWSTIYTRNGDDKQFAFPHTYQNYYVKSLTGSDETFSASFFSTGKYERSTPLLAGIQRGTKLHDVEEVPIYTASDVNKLLTVMSDGSLRWLGISESYIVELIGAGGETQAPAGTFMEELQSAYDNLMNGASVTNNILSTGATAGGMTYVDLNSDGVLEYDGQGQTSLNSSMSFWFKADQNPAAGPLYTMSGLFEKDTVSLTSQGHVIYFSNKTNIYKGHQMFLSLPNGSGAHQTLSWAINGTWADGWTHFAFVTLDNGDGTYALNVYQNGVVIKTFASLDGSTRRFFASSQNSHYGLGGNVHYTDGVPSYNSEGFNFDLDSYQIQSGVALTAEQVVEVYSQSDRQKKLSDYVVEQPAAPAGTPNVSSGNAAGLEDLAELQLFGGATMNNGVLSLPADGDAATLSHSESYEIREAKTISMWMKRDPFTGSATSFLGKTLVNKAITYGVTSFEGWSLQLLKDQNTSTNVTNYLKNNGWHNNGMLRWIASNTASTHGIDSSSFWKLPYPIDDGEWHHIVFQIDDVAIGTQPKSRMFVDGNLLTEGVSCRNNGSTIVQIGADGWLLNRFHVGQSTSARDLQFGRFMQAGEVQAGFLGGDLDGVNIDSGIKTDSEISDLFNAGRAISAAPAGTPNVSGGIEVLETNTLSGDAQVTNYEGLLIQSSGYAQTQSNYWNNATEQTISVWVKPSELGTIPTTSETLNNPTTDNNWGNNGSIIAVTRDYAATMRSNGFNMMMASNQILFLGPHQSNTYLIKNYNFEVGTWYKLTLSWNANTMKAYVNGVLVKTLSVSGSVQQGQINLKVGKHPSVDKLQFKGNILGLTVENVMKSDAEILADYEARQPQQPQQPQQPAPSLTLLSQSTAFGDASYNASTDVMTFDGTGDYATFAGGHEFTDAVTYGAWFKTTATGDRRIMSSHVRSSGNNGYFIMLNNGQLQYRRPNQTTDFTGGPNGLNDGQWHFFAVSWLENGGSFAYLDGTQIASFGGGVATGYIEGWDLYIGANPWSGNNPYGNFLGDIGGAFVENEAMTLEQIQAIYDNGPEYVESSVGTNGGVIANVLAHPDTTIVGTSTPVFENNILTFDGSSYVIHGDITEYVYSDVTTINFWMNTTTKNKFKIFNIGVASSGNAHVFHYDNGQLVWIKPQGPNHIFNGTTYHNSGWHMVTLVWDNVTGVANLYMDGQLIGTKTWAPVADPYGVGDDNYGLALGNGTGVGSFRGQTEWMVGSMTKLEITNDIWDATQVSSKFAEGSGVS